jgi:DNA polymerase-3 subunit gamma/tau
MSYQVIARKWRPKHFEQLVGQSHVSQTLLNAIKNNRLHHALLFTGPRGTGKTSSARILAMALRCPDDPNAQSQEAQDIASGRSVDVIEIDGASNNGVDAIRDLRETVGYMPSSGKHKIYIIDEVHMLSTAAFNALLKTLEEPPDHVVFVMATTEVQKIPSTILSRCQRFDFRRIPVRMITDHLEKICLEDGVDASRDALWTIAKEGDGSMRDSQSLLDQVITFSDGKITLEKTSEILGLTNRALLNEAFEAIAKRDTQVTFDIVRRLFESGADSKTFARDFLEQIRNALFIKTAPTIQNETLDISDGESEQLKTLTDLLGVEDLHMLFDMMLKGLNDLSYSADARIVLEMLLLRMAAAPRITALEELNLSGQQTAIRHNSEKKKTSLSADNNAPAVNAKSAESAHTTTAARSTNKNANPTSQQPREVALQRSNSQRPAVEEDRPATSQATNEARSSASAKTEPHMAMSAAAGPSLTSAYQSELSPQENWFQLIQAIKKDNGLIGAQLENVYLGKIEEKDLHIGIPKPLKFMYEKMTSENFREKALRLINTHWGQGHSFQVFFDEGHTEKTKPRMTPKKALELQRIEKKEADLKITKEQPLMKAIESVFEVTVQSIKEKKL